MTNKEAAAIVERIRYYMEGGECWTPTEFKAIDMAIEALTAQPDDDDTISRHAAIDAMENTDWYHINKDGQLTHGANSSEDEPLYKAEDVYKVLNDMPSVPPNLQQSCNQLATDCISRQAAIDALEKWESESTWDEWCYDHKDEAEKYSVISPSSVVFDLPSAQPEPAIPLQWIEAQIEWLKSLDNAFSTLTALQISAMVNKWKGEQDG